jgi:hypothetical protein
MTPSHTASGESCAQGRATAAINCGEPSSSTEKQYARQFTGRGIASGNA